jgi:hypothetical protein
MRKLKRKHAGAQARTLKRRELDLLTKQFMTGLSDWARKNMPDDVTVNWH